MTPENKRALRRLLIKVAIICILLACAAGACLYFATGTGLELLVIVLAALAALLTGYRCAMLSPLWAGTAWLKAVLCVLAALSGAAVLAGSAFVGLVAYTMATDGGSGGSSRGRFSSGAFD